MKTAYSPVFYFPPVAWFAWTCLHDHVKLIVKEPYQKQTFRNRCQILGPNKTQDLSIPVHFSKGQSMEEITISYDEPWQVLHQRGIQTAYGSCPYWEDYGPLILQDLGEKKEQLLEVTLPLLIQCWRWLGLNPKKISLAESQDNSRQIGGNFFDSPKKIYQHLPFNDQETYGQRFGEEFVPHLSIIDLLMNQGPEAQLYMQRLSRSLLKHIP